MPLTRRGVSSNLTTLSNEQFAQNGKKQRKNNQLKQKIHNDGLPNQSSRNGKRRSSSPSENGPKKRAFGDITNAVLKKQEGKKTQKVYTISAKDGKASKKSSEGNLAPLAVHEDDSMEIVIDECTSSQESVSSIDSEVQIMNKKNIDMMEEMEQDSEMDSERLDYIDIDAENRLDPNLLPEYASQIFDYYKEREILFKVDPYLDNQTDITKNMRAILVDWLVEVQENFELNHETLYLAVKIVDRYLMKKDVGREVLQLVGATALFIACKFDERCPPVLDDFIFICDDAYRRTEFLAMERTILKTLNFDVGVPLSYRFLRRFAKCSKATMETLTLARYILELTLQDYDFCVNYKESHLAAATLLLAFKMKRIMEWDSTLEHYSGYKSQDILPCVKKLNALISNPNKQLATVRTKYSHRVFFEVAKIPSLDMLEL